jgi:predicted permease
MTRRRWSRIADGWREITFRMRAVFRRGRYEREMAEEIRHHLELEAAARKATGATAGEADASAARSFGGIAQTKERCRDARRFVWLEQFAQDIRYALRSIAHARAFTATAVLTMALGIGACTAMYTVVDTILYHPETTDPALDRQVYLREVSAGRNLDMPVALGTYLAWEKAQSFEHLTTGTPADLTLTGEGEPIQLRAAAVTQYNFDVHHAVPILGRTFSAEDCASGGAKVVIVTYQLWQSVLGGDPHVIGRKLQINDEPYIVIGVLPPLFARSSTVDAIVPLSFSEARMKTGFGARFLDVWGRLKPGVTVEQAQAELAVISARLAQEYPATHRGWKPWVRTNAEIRARGGLREALWILAGAVTCVLLIACANVANLLLARAASRQREIAVRCALGAGRGRIIRQLLTESVLLSAAGGAAGILLTHWIFDLLHHYTVTGLRALQFIEIDSTALGIALTLSLLTGIGFGIAPAWISVCASVSEGLKQQGHNATESRTQGRLRRGLVILEIVCAVVLLAATGALIRRFVDRARINIGFDPEGVTAMQLYVGRHQFTRPAQYTEFVDALRTNLGAIASVQSAAAVTLTPWSAPFALETMPPMQPPDMPRASFGQLTPDGFRTLGVRIQLGRDFTDRDTFTAPPVAIINATMAKMYFDGTNPIGRQLKLPWSQHDASYEIVGVVSDFYPISAANSVGPQIWIPYAQQPMNSVTFLARAKPGQRPTSLELRTEVYRINPHQSVMAVRTLADLYGDAFVPQKFTRDLLGIFSSLALLLAAVGIYAVLAYSVTQRTTEIGIRMALGATVGNILRLIFEATARMLVIGVAIGVVATYTVSYLVRSMLFGVDARDPVVLSAVVVALVIAGVLASVLPAYRAARVNPMVALKCE